MGNTISYTEVRHDLDLGPKGALRGIQYDNKAVRYAGVPFALPPVGEWRWRKPRPLPETHIYSSPCGKEPFDATQFGKLCPQKAFSIAVAEGGVGAYSEDCLTLNIWTPVNSSDETDKKWPVMLWLHGGWFQMGDPCHDPGMHPIELISSGKLNAVVVAISYRLNIFGFLANEAGANYGLWDQRLAIEWVHENISLFGGDPTNITMAGRSAGAYSGEAQMLYEFRKPGSSPTDNYFRRAFICSNAIPAQPKSIRDTRDQFDEVCAFFKVDKTLSLDAKMDVLRGISAESLVEALSYLENYMFRPVTDNDFIHEGMMEYLQSPQFAEDFKSRDFKILIGETSNENTLYATYNAPDEPTVDSLKTKLANYYSPNVVERILLKYEMPKSMELEDWRNLFGQIIADGQVRAPSRLLVNYLSSHGISTRDIWRYQVAYRFSFITDTIAPKSYGVAHSMDKPLWNFAITHGPTPAERNLMNEWARILVAFVNDDEAYDFGSRDIQSFQVATPDAEMKLQLDQEWQDLISKGEVFAG